MGFIELSKDINYKENIENALINARNVNDKLNAVVTFTDVSKQLDELKSNGKMHGIPIALKDNVCTLGTKTTASSNILSNYIPIYDAHIVTKLKEAGAVYICKTSMDELGMGGTNLTAATGAVYNPWDLSRISGGSSGGSAAIVSSGAVSFSIGTDTGDSVRKPASYCGVIGVKPTYGRISRYGIIPYASSLDHVGYFCQNVLDASIALEVLAGRDDRDMTSSYKEVKEYSKLLNSDLSNKKIAVFKNVIDSISNLKTKEIFNDLIEKLKNNGALVEYVELNQDLLRAILPTYFMISNCEAVANHSNLDGIRFGNRQDGSDTDEIMINTRSKGFSDRIKKRFVIGSYGLFEENQEKLFRKAQKVRRLIVEEFKNKLDGYDCIIAPASAFIAPKIDEVNNMQDYNSDEYLIAENHMIIGNFTGYPSMTLPMGFIDECPIGVNITCKAFDEELMFNIALGIEEATGLKNLVKGSI